MKTALWQRCLKRYVVPNLPGAWGVSGRILYQEPAEWLLCCLVLSQSPGFGDFSVDIVIQLLPSPFPTIGGQIVTPLGLGIGAVNHSIPANLADAEFTMRDITALIHAHALPLFAEHGTLDGYRKYMEDRYREEPDSIRLVEGVFCMRLIQGDRAEALAVAAQARTISDVDKRQWVVEVADRIEHVANLARGSETVAIDELRSYAAQMRKQFRIPEPPANAILS